MKRSRDDPSGSHYSCQTYEEYEEVPHQHLHFVDVGLRLVSPERLVDPISGTIVPGAVGVAAISSSAAASSSSNNTTSTPFTATSQLAMSSATMRNLVQRVQPVAKGFPALQYFACPKVADVERHPQTRELDVYYITDDRQQGTAAARQLMTMDTSTSTSGPSPTTSTSPKCPYHYFKCSCHTFATVGTALRRLYEEFNGGFDWDVYVSEEEERRRLAIGRAANAVAAARYGSTADEEFGTHNPTTDCTFPDARSNYGVGGNGYGGVGGSGGSGLRSPNAPKPYPLGSRPTHLGTLQRYFQTPPTSPVTGEGAGAGGFPTANGGGRQHPPPPCATSNGKFRPTLTAPKVTAFCVGSGLQHHVEIKPISADTVRGSDFWYHSAINTDVEVMQCLYEAMVAGTEAGLLATTQCREDVIAHRYRQQQQRWCAGPLMVLAEQEMQKRSTLVQQYGPDAANHPIADPHAEASAVLAKAMALVQNSNPNDGIDGVAPLAVVLFLNVTGGSVGGGGNDGTTATATPNPNATATHAILFITTPNAPLALARRIIGPIALAGNGSGDTPLSVMTALALHTSIPTVAGASSSSAPLTGAASPAYLGVPSFPRCTTCKNTSANLVKCRLCNKNMICPPPTNYVAGSGYSCHLQYQCQTCGVTSCGGCSVVANINGVSGRKCMECLCGSGANDDTAM